MGNHRQSRFAGNFDYVVNDPAYQASKVKTDLLGIQREIEDMIASVKYTASLTQAQKDTLEDLKQQAYDQKRNVTPEQQAIIAKYGFIPSPVWQKRIDDLRRDRAIYEAKWVDQHSTWLQKAAATAGRALTSITHAIGAGIHGLGDLMAQIPLVGPAFHAVLSFAAGPFDATEAVLTGERIDHVVLNQLKSTVAVVQEIAPYAETVLSVMPGVGTGLAGAIGTSLALAEGKPIDDAMVEGFAKAIPGGEVAKGLFKVSVAAINGENIPKATADAAIDALNLPTSATKAVKSGLNIAYQAAKGENIPKAALEEARKNLGDPNLQHAFDAAVAVGHGKKLQDAVVQGIKEIGPSQLGPLADKGKEIIGNIPVIQDVYKGLDSAAQEGYRVGLGLMNSSGVNEQTITMIRDKYGKAAQTGYDLAVSTHIAGVIAPPPPKAIDNKAAGAYFATYGMQGATQLQKTAMVTHLTKTEPSKFGVILAANELARQRSWWGRFKNYFGFKATDAIELEVKQFFSFGTR